MQHNLLDSEKLEELGDVYYEACHFAEAENAYIQALDLRSNNKSYLFSQLGNIHFKRNNYVMAEQYYNNSLALHSDNDVLVNLGDACFQQGKVNEAINYFVSAIIHDSQDAAIYSRLGVAYQQAGHNVQAMMAHLCAVKLNDKYLKYYECFLTKLPQEIRDEFCDYISGQEEKILLGYYQFFISQNKLLDTIVLACLKEVTKGRGDHIDDPNVTNNEKHLFLARRSSSLNTLPTPKPVFKEDSNDNHSKAGKNKKNNYFINLSWISEFNRKRYNHCSKSWNALPTPKPRRMSHQ